MTRGGAIYIAAIETISTRVESERCCIGWGIFPTIICWPDCDRIETLINAPLNHKMLRREKPLAGRSGDKSPVDSEQSWKKCRSTFADKEKHHRVAKRAKHNSDTHPVHSSMLGDTPGASLVPELLSPKTPRYHVPKMLMLRLQCASKLHVFHFVAENSTFVVLPCMQEVQ